MVPIELRLTHRGTVLEIAWDDGMDSQLSATVLRENCRSSAAERARIDGTAATPSSDIEVIGIELVGNYAVNLAFSDGHDRGIYPWSYLRALAARGAGRPTGGVGGPR